MANRYPLIVDTSDGNKLKEIPSGDNLQLAGNGIIGVTDVTASGTVAAGVLSATSIKKGGTEIATVAVTGSYNDLSNRPTALSQFTNDSGFITSVDAFDGAYGSLSGTPTLGTASAQDVGYFATAAQGALSGTALQSGANISLLFNNSGYLTAADLADNVVNINYTGDLVGSVFADDSTLMIDSVLAAFNLDQTIRTNVVPAANGVYDLGTDANKFKDLYLSGNILTNGITQTLIQSFLSNSQSLQLTKASARIISFSPVGTGATVLLPEEDYEGIIFTLISLAGNANSFTVGGALSSFTVAPGEVKSFVFDGSDWTLASTSTGGGGGGVTSIVAGTGITINQATGAVTITATGGGAGFDQTLNTTDDVIFNDVTVNGAFSSGGVGSSEIVSANNLELTAANAVIVTSSPLRLASFTTTQRNALAAQNGDMIYNTTDNKFQGYENGAWANLI